MSIRENSHDEYFSRLGKVPLQTEEAARFSTRSGDERWKRINVALITLERRLNAEPFRECAQNRHARSGLPVLRAFNREAHVTTP